MSISVCNECETIIESSEITIEDELCCPYCDEPCVQVSEDG